MLQSLSIFRRFDWLLFLSAALLAGLGVLAIWTVDLARDPGAFFNFKKQMIFAVGGLCLALVAAIADFRAWRSSSRLLYIGGLIILAAVLVFGQTIRGTRGWFMLGDISFQPVELAKIILILVLAKYLETRAHIIDGKVIVSAAILLGVYLGLILAQPDFGSALVICLIAVGMLLFTNVPRRYIIGGIVSAAIIVLLVWGFALQNYQKDRVRILINPDLDPFGRGYNVRQSVIAVGAGGIFGRGLGQGSQSQLRFLPEAQTDFVFAVLSEQLGFFIAFLIIVAYGVMIWRAAAIMKRTNDGFALFVVAGFIILIAAQTVLNIGMNTGLIPIVGLPLPFVSLGGSAMLANFLMLGIVESIKARG